MRQGPSCLFLYHCGSLTLANDSQPSTSDLSRLVADIKADKCALVLGLEIFSVQDEPLQTH